MADFRVFKKKEWWRESGETPDYARRVTESAPKAPAKKTEEYDLKRGDDGKNHPSITTQYATKSAKAPVKKVAEKVRKVRQIVEAEFDDEDDDFNVDDEALDTEGMGDELGDDEGMADINPEDDMGMEDDGFEGGSVCTCPACGAKLVIETSDEEEAEGEHLGDDEGMEGMGDEEMGDGMGVESEDQDMSFGDDEGDEEEIPKLESKKDKFGKYAKKVEAKRPSKSIKEEEKEFEEAYQSWKKERMRRIETLKAKSRKKLEAESEIGVAYGSDTGKMVKKGQTNSGSKTDVGQGNDDDFGINPQDTNDMVRRGQTNSGTKTKQSEKKVLKRKPIAEEEQAAVTDPFEDESDADQVVGDDFANVPIDVGADPDAITKYKGVQERRKARANSTLSESVGDKAFNFKDLVRGIYK